MNDSIRCYTELRSLLTVVLSHKQKERTYLLLRPIPHNYAVPTVDQVFYDAATHDTQTKEPKFQGRRKDVFLFKGLRQCFHV